MKPRRVSEAFPSLCGSLCRSSFSRRSLTCSGGWRLLGNGRMKAYVTMIPKASWGTRPQDQRPITCLARCFGARRLMPRLFSVFSAVFIGSSGIAFGITRPFIKVGVDHTLPSGFRGQSPHCLSQSCPLQWRRVRKPKSPLQDLCPRSRGEVGGMRVARGSDVSKLQAGQGESSSGR